MARVKAKVSRMCIVGLFLCMIKRKGKTREDGGVGKTGGSGGEWGKPARRDVGVVREETQESDGAGSKLG